MGEGHICSEWSDYQATNRPGCNWKRASVVQVDSYNLG